MKNIVLITVDSLRYDHSKVIKEKMVEVLGEGIDFEEAYSTGPSSISSYVGYLSSKYPTFPDEKYFILHPKINRKRILLFEVLKNNGYKTYVISNNKFHEIYGYDKGIDVMIRKNNNSEINKLKEKKSSNIMYKIMNKIFNREIKIGGKSRNNMPNYSAEEITDIVKNILKNGFGTQRIFMQINYLDTHTPLNMSNKYIRKNMREDQIVNSRLGFKEIYEIRNLIDNSENNGRQSQKVEDRLNNYAEIYNYETLYVADHINNLLKYFKKSGMLKNTLFILHSDHGEYIKPEGKLLGHGHPVKNKEEAVNVFYDNIVHVPLTVWGVGRGKVDKLVSLIDLPSTILEIIGIEKPVEWYGNSLFSDKEKPIICEDVRHGYKCYSVRTKDWVFAYNKDTEQEYLFKRSPEDKQDLSGKRTDVVKHMHELLEIHNEKIKGCWIEYIKRDVEKIIEKGR
tara:strand:- start:3284 stop:4642 length:1359 start_codon:yes stop_codon:yes gene_type:complete